jgi:hypothetical protein
VQKRSLTEKLEDAWYWCVDNWHISIIGIMIIGAIAIAGRNKYTDWREDQKEQAEHAASVKHKAEVAKEAARLEALKPWAPLPEPPMPIIGTLPETPTLDPLGFTMSNNGSGLTPGSPENIALRLRLKRLVETHPRTEINSVFNKRVLTGELMLNFETQQGEFAAFMLLPRNQIGAMQKEDRRPLVPMFTMSLLNLANTDTPEEIREAWLVLFHENWHYEQYLSAPADEKALFVSKKKRFDEQIPKSECDHQWKVERDAYTQECRLALEWGMPDVWNGVCRRVDDDAAFNQALFNWFVQSSPVQACFQAWGTLAGHPHPEAYAIPR